MGIQSKILSIVGAMILVVILLATLLNSLRVQSLSKALSLEVAEETAQRYGLEVKGLLTSALEHAQLLEASFWQLRSANVDRGVLDQILRENTRMHRAILGSWMLWEPNAYDNKDADYVVANNPTGRVNSFWHWAGSDVVHEANVDWESSGWYQHPKKRLKETLEEPYLYNVSGEELLLISSIQPIVHDDTFYGVVGVDLKLETIQKLVGSLRVLDSGYSALIADNGMYVAHPNKDRIGKNIKDFEIDYSYFMSMSESSGLKVDTRFDEVLQASAYHLLVNIEVANTGSSWTLMVTLPESKILGPANDIRNEIFIIGVISGLLMLFLLTLLTRKLLAPILEMSHVLKIKFDEKLGIFPHFNIVSQDEFGELAFLFNQMSLEINESRTQLEQLNIELSIFNEQLEARVLLKTKKLLESEKMASLGRLVTGVSHELNTPVGICVTAVSYLQEQVTVGSNATTEEIKESLLFLSENLNKVSSLINSFKLLSVSSSEEDKILFSCRELIAATAGSARSQFDVKHIHIHVEGSDVEVLSYPNALSQVINHIVTNSIIHGFGAGSSEQKDKSISIFIESDDSLVTIICSDNGIGMSKEMTDKIFEAFSTQRLGAEGKGLGMNIVYNVVTQTLKGTIECESELGEGTLYRIQFSR